MNQWRHLRRALRYFRPDTGRVGLALLLLLLGTGANLLKPWPIAWTVDFLIEGKTWPAWIRPWTEGRDKAALIFAMALVTFLIHAAQAALSAEHTFTLIRIGLNGLGRVRNELFQWLQRLSWRYYHETRQGDLIYRASWDVYAFQTLFQHGLFAFLAAGLSLLLMFAVMWQVNATLAVVILGTVPFLMGIIRVLGREMARRSLAAHQADGQLTSLVQQGIAALPLIQSYGMEQVVAGRFALQNREALARRERQHGFEVAYLALIALIFAAGVAAVVWQGTRQVWAGRLSVGGLLVFIAYLGQFYEPLNQLSHVGSTLADAFAGTQRVFEILDSPEEVRELPDARPVVRTHRESVGESKTPAPLFVKGGVRFRQAGFAYQTGRPILRDVSLALEPGEAAALIGPSGAGKSTLIHLVPRFFDPTSGSVELDGVDTRRLRLRDLRAQIALVMQEPVLLPGTVAENIACGRPQAAAQEIEAAARAAHAHEFIAALPQGYLTLIGEGAARLSTGEKQRLNLARAFLKDAPILILDEPTSGLDAQSEALVVDSLRALMRGRTTLIVAHRMTTIRHVDKIFVLESGQITEWGTPAELLARGGYYARAIQG